MGLEWCSFRVATWLPCWPISFNYDPIRLKHSSSKIARPESHTIFYFNVILLYIILYPFGTHTHTHTQKTAGQDMSICVWPAPWRCRKNFWITSFYFPNVSRAAEITWKAKASGAFQWPSNTVANVMLTHGLTDPPPFSPHQIDMKVLLFALLSIQ